MKRFACLVLALMLTVPGAVSAGAESPVLDVIFGKAFAQNRVMPNDLTELFTNFYGMAYSQEMFLEIGEMSPFIPDASDGAFAVEIPMSKSGSLIVYLDGDGETIIGLELSVNVHEDIEAAEQDLLVLYILMYGALLPDATPDDGMEFVAEMINGCVSTDGGYAAEYTKQIGAFNVCIAKEEQHIDVMGETSDLYYITLNIGTAQSAFGHGFEEAEFEKFNSPASENELEGTRICVTGMLTRTDWLKIESDQFDNLGVILGYVQTDDGHEWLAQMHAAPIVVPTDFFDDYVGRRVILRGIYDGYSSAEEMPVFTLDRLMDVQTGETKEGMATFIGAME